MATEQSSGVDFQRGPEAFIERRKKPTRTALISPDLRVKGTARDSLEARRAEFSSLAGAIHLNVLLHKTLPVRNLRPSTFFGAGQVAALAQELEEREIDLVLVDTALSPIQQRNLERDMGVKVLDRTALILEIFGERAATREGVLQVELAHLNYQRSRLVRSWTHLERQRGGFGFLGGPGETQIEADRRQLRDRVALLEKRIEKVRKTRQMQRKPRDAVPFPMVALVGYTNAGKSTLFNRLTGAEVEAKDVLFATLDTTVRKVTLPHQKEIILSDTVGFIADLPTDLVAAFRATLEEVVLADIILHVRDISNPDHEAQAREVVNVLMTLGVEPKSTPMIEVWNKVDLLEENPDLWGIDLAGEAKQRVGVSAVNGQGVEELLQTIEQVLATNARHYNIFVPHDRGEDIGWLYAHSEVMAQSAPGEEGTNYHVRVQPRHLTALVARFKGRLNRS